MVNPYAFAPAIAPHIAAAQAGIAIDLNRIVAAFEWLQARSDRVIVEGAGGWLAPISDAAGMQELARAINIPVLLVVGLRLGCLNHALLTARSIESSGLAVVGWVANRIEPKFPYWEENVETLKARLPAPLLGIVEYQATLNVEAAARSLDVAAL
jgi:dethiobiotin synthetase